MIAYSRLRESHKPLMEALMFDSRTASFVIHLHPAAPAHEIEKRLILGQ